MTEKTTKEKIEAIYELVDFEIADAIKKDKRWIPNFLNFLPQGLAAHNLKNLLEASDRHSIKVIKKNGKVLLSSKVTRPDNVKVNPPNFNEKEGVMFDEFFNEGKLLARGYVGSTFNILLDDGYSFEIIKD